jgi:PAS domain S-box-containing protein
MQEILERIRRGERIEHFETIRLSKSGQPIPVSLSVSPVKDSSGRIVGAAKIARDITERKRAEEALQRSESRFRAMAETVPDILFTTDPDGTMNYINPRFYDLTGREPGSADGHGWMDSIHPADAGMVRTRWEQMVEIGHGFRGEFRLRMADGSYRWFITRARPVRDEDGRISRWFGSSTDVHEQKRAEELLRDTDRRKDEFLAVLAHELRNPLVPIRNAVHVLRLVGADKHRLEKARDMIERQVMHMTRLIDDLLDLSRISRGKILLRKESLDLAAVVRSVASDYAPLLHDKGLLLDLVLPDRPVYSLADPTRIAQALGNLLHNAMKFSEPEGCVRIRLETSSDPPRCTIRVADQGIGIRPEMMPRLFEAFSQDQAGLDREHGGLGLGLALVKGLVRLHGGEVGASSDGPGRGSEFWFELPRGTEPAPSREAAPSAATLAGNPRRILLIEDNPHVSEGMRFLLESLGHWVSVAKDGQAGLEAARKTQPEVILCDVGLPGSLDGYAVAGQIRRDGAYGSPYLVALTGYGREEDKLRALESGFDLHLTKPIDPSALERVLRRLASQATGPGLSSSSAGR